MNLPAQVTGLIEKHAALDDIITEESGRPRPDFLKITELKRQKLKLKDEIASVKH